MKCPLVNLLSNLSIAICNLAFAAQLQSQEAVFTSRHGENTAYCGPVGGPKISRLLSSVGPTHDIASVNDPGSTNWPASGAESQLDATPSPLGITLAGIGSARRDPLQELGVYATADTRDAWEFTLTAPARFTLNASLSGSSTEALSPFQGYAFGGLNADQVNPDPGVPADAFGASLIGSGTKVRHARGRLLAGRYSISLICRVEGTNFPFSGSFNSFVTLSLAPDAPLISQFRILPQGLELKWADLGSKQYTVEATDSLVGDRWMSVSGTAWPVSTSTVVVPLPNTFPRFYRVKME